MTRGIEQVGPRERLKALTVVSSYPQRIRSPPRWRSKMVLQDGAPRWRSVELGYKQNQDQEVPCLSTLATGIRLGGVSFRLPLTACICLPLFQSSCNSLDSSPQSSVRTVVSGQPWWNSSHISLSEKHARHRQNTPKHRNNMKNQQRGPQNIF